ncbi:MAG: response regulator [Desulfobacteraceae bacterium]|nr:response regulator [Desulfobacteraceae bacterium]
MFPNSRGYIKDSIAAKLLKVVFVLYLAIAVIVTLFHMTAEYYYMKDDVYQELKDLQGTFEPIIARALWNVNIEQLKSAGKGILDIPSVVGVHVKDENEADIIAAGLTDISGKELFSFKFQAYFIEYDSEARNAGSVTFFSSTEVVFKRVRLGFLFIIINAIIKTTALWLIFLWLSRRILSRPLAILTSATEKMDFNNLENFQVDVKTSGRNELKLLEESFNSMVRKLHLTMTERRDAEKKLEESEQMLNSIVKSVPDIIYRLDPDGMILFINDAVKRYGYRPEELIGKDMFDIVHPEDLKIAHFHINERRTGDRRTRNLEIRLIGRKNVSGSFELRSKSVAMEPVFLVEAEGLYSLEKNETETFMGTQGIARDISLRKQAEKEKLALEEQLRQVYKMEAIGTLAGGIAHDFNNILTVIIGNTELLMLKFSELCTERERLVNIHKASHRAKDLVEQILAFSRKSEQECQPVQIRVIVKEALKFLKSSLPSTIEIRQNITIGSDTVMADPTHIHQVLMNLCTNARHAVGKKGGILEVALSLKEITADGAVAYPDLAPGTWIELSVTDTGHGMDSATVERIFEPYYTTKDKGVGTGLGLAVVHGIVKSYRGVVTVDSELGKGSVFHIFFPRAEKNAIPDADETVPLSLADREHILLVDDEEMLLEMGENILKELGYEVVTAICSEQALKLFSRNPDAFDLVITDMTMPKMTGDVLAEKLMQIRPSIPVILCTGFSELINREKSEAKGIRELLTKPYSVQQLSEAIQKHLG